MQFRSLDISLEPADTFSYIVMIRKRFLLYSSSSELASANPFNLSLASLTEAIGSSLLIRSSLISKDPKNFSSERFELVFLIADKLILTGGGNLS